MAYHIATVVLLLKGEPAIIVNGVGTTKRIAVARATGEEDWFDGITQFDEMPELTLTHMEELDEALLDGRDPQWLSDAGFATRVFYNEV